eukprot:scaffold8044_cov277-Pinguiococcus_pyrenoidosus.AAC.5
MNGGGRRKVQTPRDEAAWLARAPACERASKRRSRPANASRAGARRSGEKEARALRGLARNFGPLGGPKVTGALAFRAWLPLSEALVGIWKNVGNVHNLLLSLSHCQIERHADKGRRDLTFTEATFNRPARPVFSANTRRTRLRASGLKTAPGNTVFDVTWDGHSRPSHRFVVVQRERPAPYQKVALAVRANEQQTCARVCTTSAVIGIGLAACTEDINFWSIQPILGIGGVSRRQFDARAMPTPRRRGQRVTICFADQWLKTSALAWAMHGSIATWTLMGP